MDITSYQYLKVTLDGPLAIVTLDREAQLNALNSVLLAELTTVVGELELSDDVRVVAITGKGRAFVAGADIAEMREMNPAQAHAFSELGGALGAAIRGSTKPYVAAVNGVALGGGCELALTCDFIYASDKAKFGQPEVKLGVIPGFGGTQRLPRRVGVSKAKELCMTGDHIDAAEALRIGLADEVFPADQLMAKVAELAKKIAATGPLAVAEVKQLINVGQSVPLEAALALEAKSFGILFATADQREGMNAFLDKRTARFEGK
jgi:enoyl-CoA hydratase